MATVSKGARDKMPSSIRVDDHDLNGSSPELCLDNGISALACL